VQVGVGLLTDDREAGEVEGACPLAWIRTRSRKEDHPKRILCCSTTGSPPAFSWPGNSKSPLHYPL
jgi:hypothetical protein